MDRIFGHSIAHFREEKNMTQTLAARLAGITQSQLSRIEDGENWPNKSTLRKICKGGGFRATNSLITWGIISLKFPNKEIFGCWMMRKKYEY